MVPRFRTGAGRAFEGPGVGWFGTEGNPLLCSPSLNQTAANLALSESCASALRANPKTYKATNVGAFIIGIGLWGFLIIRTV